MLVGITGTVSIDANGDRNADYSLLDMDPNTGQFRVIISLLSIYSFNRLQCSARSIIKKLVSLSISTWDTH